MNKQRRQTSIKRYISFFALCVLSILIGVILSVPIKVEVDSTGAKPPFRLALLLSALLLAAATAMVYSTYLCWFQGAKALSNVKRVREQLAKRSPLFRLPIYDPTFLFWFIRIVGPIATIVLFGLFRVVLLSAF